MQSVSGNFLAMAQRAGQYLVTYLEVAWDGNEAVTDARGAAAWTDETAYLVKHSGTLRIDPPGVKLVAAGETGQLSVTLDNTADRYSWHNAASPLYAYISGAAGLAGKPIRLWQGFTTNDPKDVGVLPEWVCIFTGIVAGWRPDVTAATVELDCRDWGYKYLQDKRSTVVSYDQPPATWITSVATNAGITIGALDLGIYAIPFCWLDDESAVEEIWQTAEADGGLCYFDQRGQLHFENALHWPGHTTSLWTVADGAAQRVDADLDLDAVATQVVVEWSARGKAPDEPLYTLDRLRTIMPGATETWTARFQYAATRIVTPDAADPYNDYAAQAAGGRDLTGDLTVTLSDVCAQQATVSVHNTATAQAAILNFLQIRGTPLVGGPTEQETVDATPAPFTYKRLRSVRDNIYLQTQAQGQALAQLLAVRCRRIRPRWKLYGLTGVPQLELGDRVTFYDTHALGSGVSADGLVVEMRWRGSATDGFVQDWVLLGLDDLSAYTDYFIIGVDTLGTTARAYY